MGTSVEALPHECPYFCSFASKAREEGWRTQPVYRVIWADRLDVGLVSTLPDEGRDLAKAFVASAEEFGGGES